MAPSPIPPTPTGPIIESVNPSLPHLWPSGGLTDFNVLCSNFSVEDITRLVVKTSTGDFKLSEYSFEGGGIYSITKDSVQSKLDTRSLTANGFVISFGAQGGFEVISMSFE